MRGQIGDGYFGWVSNAHLWICSGGEFHGVGRTGYKQLLFSGKQENHRNGLKIFFFQGNWHDLNEFFEYATEWEPSASLYFGDNILQVQLALTHSLEMFL